MDEVDKELQGILDYAEAMRNAEVGDRVRCISPEYDAPRGIVGTIVEIGRTPLHLMMKAYWLVKWDEGQNDRVDEMFPEGTWEGPGQIEKV